MKGDGNLADNLEGLVVIEDGLRTLLDSRHECLTSMARPAVMAMGAGVSVTGAL